MMPSIESELAVFHAGDVTVRLCTALLGAMPGATPLAAFATLDEAFAALHPGSPPAVLERAKAIASAADTVQALLLAGALDAGDRGITLQTGLSTAMSLFFGKKVELAADAQQQADAATKAWALAVLLARLLPGDPAERAHALEQLPTGSALLRYFGAIEVALPFLNEVKAADGKFVATLVAKEPDAPSRVAPVAGKDGVTAAEATMPALLPTLEKRALDGAANVGPITETVKGYLPSLLGGARDSLPDLVATGADSLPVYRYLVARLAAEACLWRAREEVEGATRPAATAPTVAAAPVAAGGSPAAANPFAMPFTAPTAPGEAAAGHERAAAEANPFAVPFTAPTAPSLVAAGGSPAAANPFAAPFTAPTTPGEAAGGHESTAAGGHESTAAGGHESTAAGGHEKPRTAGHAAAMEDFGAAPPPPSSARPKPPPPKPQAAPAERPPAPKEPLAGAFVFRSGDDEMWLVFSKDGWFSTEPPATPPPVDWGAARAAGARLAFYDRQGERLRITWPDGRVDEATLRAGDYDVDVDGRTCRRADFDLTGRWLEGAWSSDAGGFRFVADGRFAAPGDPRGGGTYALGPSSVALTWQGGGVERLALLSDLDPSAESPDRLWIAGRRYSRG